MTTTQALAATLCLAAISLGAATTAEAQKKPTKKPKIIVLTDSHPHAMPAQKPQFFYILNRSPIERESQAPSPGCKGPGEEVSGCDGLDEATCRCAANAALGVVRRLGEAVRSSYEAFTLEVRAAEEEARWYAEALERFEEGRAEWLEEKARRGDGGYAPPARVGVGSEGLRAGIVARADALRAKIRALELKQDEARDRAIALLEAYTTRAKDPDALFQLALLQLDAANVAFIEADEAFMVALEAFETGETPDAPPEPRRDYVATRATLDRILKEHKGYTHADQVLYIVGFVATHEDEVARARAAFEALVTKHPASPLVAEAWLRLGELAFDDNALDLAEEAYIEACRYKGSPHYDKALYKLAWTYYRADKFDEAIKAFSNLIAFNLERGRVDLSTEDLMQEALQYLAVTLIERDRDLDGVPDAPPAEAQIAALLDEVQARLVFPKVVEVLFESTRYEEVLTAGRAFLKRFPGDRAAPTVHHKLLFSLDRMRRFDDLAKERDVFIDRYARGAAWAASNAANPDALADAEPLVRLHRVQLAHMAHLEGVDAQAKATSASTPEAIALAQAHCTKAATAYQMLLEAYPDDEEAPEWLYLLADTLAMTQKYDRAAALYDQILLEPDIAYKHRNIAEQRLGVLEHLFREAKRSGASKERLKALEERVEAARGWFGERGLSPPGSSHVPKGLRYKTPAVRGEGLLDSHAIDRTFKRNHARVARCAEKARGGGASVKVVVDLTIGGDGRVLAVTAKSVGHAPELERCVSSVVRRLRFPKPEGGSVPVTKTFVFAGKS